MFIFLNWVKSQIATVPGCQAGPGPWFPEGSLPSSLGAPSSLRVCRDLSENVHGEGRGQRRREVAGWVCGGQRLQGAAFGIASTQALAAGGRASWEVGLSRDGRSTVCIIHAAGDEEGSRQALCPGTRQAA